MLKDEILGDQVPRHRRNWFALVYRSSLICALLLVSLQIFVPSTSFAHSNTYKDGYPPFGWRRVDTVTIKSFGNGLFVSANGNDVSRRWPLEASKTDVSPKPDSWEKFELWQYSLRLPGRPDGVPINAYAFKSIGNSLFVSANGNDVSHRWPLEASQTNISPASDSWEVFNLAPDRSRTLIHSVGNNSFVSANGNVLPNWPLEASTANPDRIGPGSWEGFDIEHV